MVRIKDWKSDNEIGEAEESWDSLTLFIPSLRTCLWQPTLAPERSYGTGSGKS